MHRKTKLRIVAASLGTVLVLVLLLVVTSPAFAACFPDTGGHWAEPFICWVQAHGIVSGYGDGTYRPDNNVTRGEMAVFIQRVAEVPPTTGLILVTTSFGDWVPFNSADPLTWNYFSGGTEVDRGSAGAHWLNVHPSIPTVLYGKSVSFNGVEFCYDTITNTTLDSVEINSFTHSTGSGTRNQLLFDGTDRTDAACRVYYLTTPVTLTAEEGVNFYARVAWSAAGTFEIGRTTFIFLPTDTTAVGPSGLETAGEGGGPDSEPSNGE